MIWQFVALTLICMITALAVAFYAFNAGYAAGIRYARKKLMELATETIEEVYELNRKKNV